MTKYPRLKSEIVIRGIAQKEIARVLCLNEKTVSHKIQGKSAFTWPEVCKIQSKFFPDIDKDTLFASADIYCATNSRKKIPHSRSCGGEKAQLK